MKKTVAIGIQSFEDIVLNNCFYIGKTEFIRVFKALNFILRKLINMFIILVS